VEGILLEIRSKTLKNKEFFRVLQKPIKFIEIRRELQ